MSTSSRMRLLHDDLSMNSIYSQMLYVTADKYFLYELKKMCEGSLCSTMTIENVVNRLILADRHRCEELKSHAIDFVNSHPDEIMKTDGWKTMVDQHPHLISEALSAILKNKTSVGESFINASEQRNLKYIYTRSKHISERTSSVHSEDVIQINLPTYQITTPTCWSYTWLKDVPQEDNVSYVWEVRESSMSVNTLEHRYKSSTFCATKNKNLKWYLEFIQGRNDDYFSRPLSIRLVLEDCLDVEVDVKFKMSVKRVGDGNERKELSGENVFQKEMPYWESEIFEVPSIVDLTCAINFIKTDTVSISVQKKADVGTPSVCSLPYHMHRLLESQKLSDVTFIVQDQKIHAHKAIVAARSRVFSEMFFRNSKENRFEIADMDYKVCQEMFRFIYTGDV